MTWTTLSTTQTFLRPVVNASTLSLTLPICDPAILRAVKTDLFAEMNRFASIGENMDCKDVSGELLVFMALKRCPEETLQALVLSLSPTSPSLFAQNSSGATPLLAAAEKGFPELTGTLLRLRANRSVTDFEDRSLLHFAAPWPAILMPLLRELPAAMVLAQLRQQDTVGDTPLHRALAAARYDEVLEALHVLAQRGLTSADPTLLSNVTSLRNLAGEQLIHLNSKLELLEELLSLGADSASRTVAGAAPLHTVAALPGTAASGVLQMLQSSQVGVSAKDGRGRTPVHYAAAGGDWENVQWLVAQGADLRSRDADGVVPLELGLARGHYHLVPLFQGSGGSVLFAAAGFGNVSLVEQLVQSGMSPNAIDETGRTPMFDAAEKDRIDVAEFLISQNASLVLVDKAGITVLAAAVLARRPRMVEFLLTKQVPVEQRLANLSTVLHLAAASLPETIEVLMRAGANPLAVDFKNRSALHFASTAESVQALLHFNVSSTRSAAFGLTPLHKAAAEGNTHVLEALLAARAAEVDEVDFTGNAGLHFAVSSGAASTVAALLRWCARTSQANDAGLLPVPLAKTEDMRRLLSDGAVTGRCECDCGPFEPDSLVVTGAWGKDCTTNVSCRFGGMGDGTRLLSCARNASVPLTLNRTGSWMPSEFDLGCRPVSSQSRLSSIVTIAFVVALHPICSAA